MGIPNSLPLHRLDDHSATADDRVLPHPLRSQQQDHPGLILETLDWDCSHACVRLLERLTCALAVPGWASLVACADGSSSSSRSSVARPDLLLASLDQPTSSPRPRSAPCVSLSLQVGLFTQLATSLATSWVVNDCSLNLIYNLADFVNKIAFCLAIWQAAKNESLSGA